MSSPSLPASPAIINETATFPASPAIKTATSPASPAPINNPAPFPPPILHLRKCLIRPYDARDAPAIATAANSPEIAKWMRNTFPSPYSISDALSWISICTSASASPPCNFVICAPAPAPASLDDDGNDGKTLPMPMPIGAIGLKPQDDIHHRTMEIGYWLGTEYWGQGIATEAVEKFSEWAFERFGEEEEEGLLRLEAEVFDGNGGSARVLERAGFVFEGRKRMAVEKWGVVRDGLMYCKFRDGR